MDSLMTKKTAEVDVTKRRARKPNSSGSNFRVRKPIKHLRMAEYFQRSNATPSAHNLSGATTAEDMISFRDQQSGVMAQEETIA